ncbi:MAG TPA: ATP-dependent sacrificial sulfur transferase LarE [Geothermobacteraceae bacterium]|nr:ATP-dependent sacrificial sulfur transferase LarE [Geothermobacteraceae bacterium]
MSLPLQTDKTLNLDERYARLKDELARFGSVVVAFSGGVDSTFLLKVAIDVLGSDKVLALTATSPTYPEFEFQEACRLAGQFGARQLVVESNELEIPGFAQNDRRRCYHCKSELFSICRDKARELGYAEILDGSNLDDLQDYRPGREAACELAVRSPLLEAGLGKEDIRTLSRRLHLPTADKQAFACLSSRFPYGTEITAERLQQVDRCETFLRQQGFKNYRVRYHDEVARIEVAAAELDRFFDRELREKVTAAFKAAGFTYITLDLQGYRTGSMNEIGN